MPLVSVLIPVYNTANYLSGTIDSVLNQSFSDFELIIVDDCSTDNTWSICQRYAAIDPRIKIYQNPINLGMMANWNRGLELCQRKYFVKLDADDRWNPKMLEACISILEGDEQVGLVFTKYTLIDDEGKILDHTERTLPEYASNRSFRTIDLVKRGVHGMLQDDVLKQGVCLIRRKIFDELGLFSLHDAGDTEMWFRIGAHYKLHGVDKTYYFYRVWRNNFTRTQVLNLDKKEENLYGVRKLIIDYYFNAKVISEQEHKIFSSDNLFEYNKYAAYKFRREGKYASLIRVLFANLIHHPGRTIAFYMVRLKEKL